MTLRLSPEELNAVRALRDNQEQVDADGTFVKVPRQSVDEVLAVFFRLEKQMAKDDAPAAADPNWYLKLREGDLAVVARQPASRADALASTVIGQVCTVKKPFQFIERWPHRLALVTVGSGLDTMQFWASGDMLEPYFPERFKRGNLTVLKVEPSDPNDARAAVRKFLVEIEAELTRLRNRDQTEIEQQLYKLLKHLRDMALAMLKSGGLDPATVEACTKAIDALPSFYANEGDAHVEMITIDRAINAIRALTETAPKTET